MKLSAKYVAIFKTQYRFKNCLRFNYVIKNSLQLLLPINKTTHLISSSHNCCNWHSAWSEPDCRCCVGSWTAVDPDRNGGDGTVPTGGAETDLDLLDFWSDDTSLENGSFSLSGTDWDGMLDHDSCVHCGDGKNHGNSEGCNHLGNEAETKTDRH